MLQKVKNRLKEQKGFTLIELLAVIVILGIIAAIAIPSINGIIQKSRTDAIHAEASSVLNAAKLFAANNDIPGTGEVLTNNATLFSVTATGDLGQYLDTSVDFDYTISIVNDGGNISYEDIKVKKGDTQIDYDDAQAVLSKNATE